MKRELHPVGPVRPGVVTFDKGGRVPRLEDGVTLDARQTGILLAQIPTAGDRTVHLLEWDEAHDPHAARRMHELLATKGPAHKQTLLLALSMGVLRRFEVRAPDARFVFEGDRTRGFCARAAVAP